MHATSRLALFTSAMLAAAVAAAPTARAAPTGEAPASGKSDDGAGMPKSGTAGTVNPADAEGSNGKRTGEAPAGSSGTPRGTAAPR